MKWKICGMRDPENIVATAALTPDYMGFIFWEHSLRYVEFSTPELPSGIIKTGVFVNASYDQVTATVNKHQLQAVQLHGAESPEYCKTIQALGVEVIKAFSVKNHFDFRQLEAYESTCDFYLFDTKGELPGGNGYTFDWTLLKGYPSKKPFFLSGGIGIEQIKDLKDLLKKDLPLYCIDLNSKFESNPAYKNTELLSAFINTLFKA